MATVDKCAWSGITDLCMLWLWNVPRHVLRALTKISAVVGCWLFSSELWLNGNQADTLKPLLNCCYCYWYIECLQYDLFAAVSVAVARSSCSLDIPVGVIGTERFKKRRFIYHALARNSGFIAKIMRVLQPRSEIGGRIYSTLYRFLSFTEEQEIVVGTSHEAASFTNFVKLLQAC